MGRFAQPARTCSLAMPTSVPHIELVSSVLQDAYGTPSLGNVDEVFGELIYALLSTKSAPLNYQSAFDTLRSTYPQWADLAQVDPSRIEPIVRCCGLFRRKARAIVRIAHRVFVEDGYDDLEHLREWSTEDALAYLTSLPEVGIKVAKCVCLYALHRDVFPVDAHNLRILRRLGLVDSICDARADAFEIEAVVPDPIRYRLHVNLIAHGRAVCRATPLCSHCALAQLCPSSEA